MGFKTLNRIECRDLMMKKLSDVRGHSLREIIDGLIDDLLSDGTLRLDPVPEDQEIADILQGSHGTDVIAKLARRGFIITRSEGGRAKANG